MTFMMIFRVLNFVILFTEDRKKRRKRKKSKKMRLNGCWKPMLV